MSLVLYDATVPVYQQILGGVSTFLDKGAHAGSGVDPAEIVETRLFPDMLPFKYQILFTVIHSIGAIEAVKKGVFLPPRDVPPPDDYPGLQKIVSEAHLALGALNPEEVNALADKDMFFQLGEMKLPFTGAKFLFSFSLPNFYFHATTAYDILRSKGVPLGKRDFLGHLQLKTA